MERGNRKKKSLKDKYTIKDEKKIKVENDEEIEDENNEEIEDEINEQEKQENKQEQDDNEQEEQPTKFEETVDGIKEVISETVPEVEPEVEPEVTIEDLECIRVEFKEKLKDVYVEINDLNKLIGDKNEIIDILSAKNIDLINIDMELISNELHKGELKLNNIATVKQFERLNELEKTKGLNMAYQVSKLFLEHAGTEARLAIPTLNLIKISLDKISEKLKFIGDD